MNIKAKASDQVIEQCAVIGHRGAPAYGGENTLWGFQKALDLGADGFELDLLPTKDGKLVVGHDFDLERLIGKEQLNELFPGRTHYVNDFTLAELQRLKVTFPPPGKERYAYKDLTEEYRMPTLSEALQLLLRNREEKNRADLKIYIEIKTKEGFMKTTTLNQISALITEDLTELDLLEDENIWLQSFDFEMMDVLGQNPILQKIDKCQLAFDGIKEINKFKSEKKARRFLEKQILRRNLQMLHVWKVPSKYILENREVDFISQAMEMGIPIHLYTFRDGRHASDYKFMAALGVSGFESSEDELIYFILKGVQAVMTDNVSSALEARKKALSTKQ